MTGKLKTVSIEDGMPTTEQAIRRMTFEIHSAARAGYSALKIIHGYGSSGTGGKIRLEAQRYLTSLKKKGVITLFVPGERFSIFEEDTRRLLDRCPALRGDQDLERHNNGVTMILL